MVDGLGVKEAKRKRKHVEAQKEPLQVDLGSGEKQLWIVGLELS